MESFNQWPQLGDAGENNHGPEPESARKKKKCPQNKLKRSSLFFCDTFAFLQPISAHTHTHMHRGRRSGSHITGCPAAQHNSPAAPPSPPVYRENVRPVFPWIIPFQHHVPPRYPVSIDKYIKWGEAGRLNMRLHCNTRDTEQMLPSGADGADGAL